MSKKTFEEILQRLTSCDNTPDYYRGRDGRDVYQLATNWGIDDNKKFNAIKYIVRAGKKNGVDERDDIIKAIKTLVKYLAYLDGGK